MLVLDEASQLSTADLAMIGEAARQAGARIIATGDTAQLGAVEAGGMFRLLAHEVPAAELHEVRRFDAAWERQASIRLRDGDPAAIAAYDRHGRIRGADYEAAYDRAASMWLADHLRGKDVLLLAGSNAEAADLARRVQAKLTQLGTIGPPQAALSDGNHAGIGDLIRARLNTHIDAGGRPLTNRDTLQITAFRGPDAEVRRQRLDGTWTEPFRVPRAYLAASAELAYAGNVHVAQGRTVDTAHLLVTDSLSRQALYVGMTRGRQANTAHVITGNTAPPGHEPYQQATPESVLAGIMGRDDGDLSATEQIRQAQDWAAEPATCSPCGPPPSGRPCTPASTSRSPPGSPKPKPGATSASPPARPSTSSSAPPSSPDTTSARSSTRSPPRRWTAPGPSPASCTAACSASPCPSSPGTT